MIKIRSKANLESVLNLLYYLFNRLLFSNSLPTVKVKVAKIKDQDIAGFFCFTKETGKPIAIVIAQNYYDPVRVLVHEMCHVKWDMSHPYARSEHPPGFIRLLNQKYKTLGFDPASPEEVPNE